MMEISSNKSERLHNYHKRLPAVILFLSWFKKEKTQLWLRTITNQTSNKNIEQQNVQVLNVDLRVLGWTFLFLFQVLTSQSCVYEQRNFYGATVTDLPVHNPWKGFIMKCAAFKNGEKYRHILDKKENVLMFFKGLDCEETVRRKVRQKRQRNVPLTILNVGPQNEHKWA